MNRLLLLLNIYSSGNRFKGTAQNSFKLLFFLAEIWPKSRSYEREKETLYVVVVQNGENSDKERENHL